MAELDERAAGIEAQHGDAAPLRLGDDGAGGGTVGQALGDADDLLFQFAHEVELRLRVVDEVVEEAHGQRAGGDADVFLGVGVDDVVDAALAGAARLAAGDLGAGQVLQLEGDVLDDVPHPGAFAHALQEAARLADGAVVLVEAGQQLGEVLVEAGDLVGRPLLQLADVDFEQDGRHAGPDIGAPEDSGVADLQRHGINSGIGDTPAEALCRVMGCLGDRVTGCQAFISPQRDQLVQLAQLVEEGVG